MWKELKVPVRHNAVTSIIGDNQVWTVPGVPLLLNERQVREYVVYGTGSVVDLYDFFFL